MRANVAMDNSGLIGVRLAIPWKLKQIVKRMNPTVTFALNIVSVAGTILSLVGVIIAIVQIRKTRLAAEAAARSATSTQRAISQNVMLTDVATCTTSLEEVKVLLRSSRFESALLRVTDLHAHLLQLHGVSTVGPTSVSIDFRDALTQLAILRDLLENKLHKRETAINPAQVNNVLSGISDQLNQWLGTAKYSAISGDSNGINNV